jgi:MinD-like ATPase involved in chromosome partitioning or flagellar assembly
MEPRSRAHRPTAPKPPDAQGLHRDEVYGQAAREDGGVLVRLRRRVDAMLVSEGERQEAELDARIRGLPTVSRANVVAVISPKGGVGKTTCSFLVGNLLATHLKLRVVAVDANPDFGTLAALAPDQRRSERSLADLLSHGHAHGIQSAAELGRYVSRLTTGMHLLAAPQEAERMSDLAPDRYGELLSLLSVFYEVVVLDLGTGVAGPVAQFAIDRADQVILVTTPEWVTSNVVLSALEHLTHEHTTVAINKSLTRKPDELAAIEQRFREQRLHRSVTLPFDERLGRTLDMGAYELDGLERATRLPIKRLGLAVAEQLV